MAEGAAPEAAAGAAGAGGASSPQLIDAATSPVQTPRSPGPPPMSPGAAAGAVVASGRFAEIEKRIAALESKARAPSASTPEFPFDYTTGAASVIPEPAAALT